MKNIIVFGMPAAGKGTICKKFAKDHDFDHISTGDMLREAKSKRTKIGLMAAKLIDAGNFVPDKIMIPMVKEYIINSNNNNGFLFDGFPRTQEQAKQLNAFMLQRNTPISKALFLDINETEAIKRIKERSKAEGRPDDDDSIIMHRLRKYQIETKPVVDFFDKKGILEVLRGDLEPDAVYDRFSEAILQKV